MISMVGHCVNCLKNHLAIQIKMFPHIHIDISLFSCCCEPYKMFQTLCLNYRKEYQTNEPKYPLWVHGMVHSGLLCEMWNVWYPICTCKYKHFHTTIHYDLMLSALNCFTKFLFELQKSQTIQWTFLNMASVWHGSQWIVVWIVW